MRLAFLIITLLLTACRRADEPAQWHEEIFADIGMAKEFPAQPSIEDGEYQTIVIGDAPVAARFIAAEAGGVEMKMTIADMRAADLAVKGANVMGECYFDAELEGDVLSNVPFRLEDGTRYGIHGRIVDVTLDKDEDGIRPGRKQTSCFFAKGRLFKTEAMMADGAGQDAVDIAARFVRSLRFDVE